MNETEVVYQEGGEIRVLRGSLSHIDGNFVCLQRRDGSYRIARDRVVLIHDPSGNAGDYDGDDL